MYDYTFYLAFCHSREIQHHHSSEGRFVNAKKLGFEILANLQTMFYPLGIKSNLTALSHAVLAFVQVVFYCIFAAYSFSYSLMEHTEEIPIDIE